MMKKLLIAALCCLCLSNVALAQLGAPKITVRDTLFFLSCSYNGGALNKADWPAKFLVEDAVEISIAKYKYVKGAPLKDCPIPVCDNEETTCFKATCNGKTENIYIVRPTGKNRSRSTFYTIGAYKFAAVDAPTYRKMIAAKAKKEQRESDAQATWDEFSSWFKNATQEFLRQVQITIEAEDSDE